MKEHIYTIPVVDGFKESSECPFCVMYNKLDSDSVDYMLGPSYMEDDIRMDTNEKGFCKEHYEKMYQKQNRLGLALMIHTHLQKINKDFDKLTDNISISEKKGFFAKKTKVSIDKINSYLNKTINSCYICNRINTTFLRYIETFFHLFKENTEFSDLITQCNGFCLNHLALLLEVGEKNLNSDEFEKFLSIIFPIQKENFKRLEEEIDWFIKKFDYKFKDEPWKNSKDSVDRALLKLASTSPNQP